MKSVPAMVLLLAATVPAAAQGPKVTPILSRNDVNISWAAATTDGQRIYYRVWPTSGSPHVRLYDRASKRDDDVLAREARYFSISRASDRLVYYGPAGDGDERNFVWTLALDPRTGTAAGTPRRVSLTPGWYPALSPDGRFIAFATDPPAGGQQHLVIVPADGGPERTLLATKDARYVRWTPDGREITYVDYQDAVEMLYRVSASGGVPQPIPGSSNPLEEVGASPDGRALLVWAPVGGDSIALVSSEGKRIGSFPYVSPTWQIGWIDNARTLAYSNTQTVAVMTRSLDGGPARAISDTGMYADAVRSPDGRRVAIVTEGNGFTVFDERGRGRHFGTHEAVALNKGLVWSPDSKRIAYRARGGSGALWTVDVESGAERRLVPYLHYRGLRWTASGGALMYALEGKMAADTTWSMEMHEVTVAGVDRVLTTLKGGCERSRANCFEYLNDSTVLHQSKANQYVVSDLRGRTPDRVLLERHTADQPGFYAVSRNGAWLAAFQNDASGKPRVVDVIATDGTNRRRVTLPFEATDQERGLWVSNDGTELVVAAPGPSPTPAGRKGRTYYRFSVATGTSTRLIDIPGGSRTWGAEISADGKSLTYSADVQKTGSLYEWDYTEMLRAAGMLRRP